MAKLRVSIQVLNAWGECPHTCTRKQIEAFIGSSKRLRPASIAGGHEPGLRVWVGAIKLDKRFPEFGAIQHFMYGTPDNSAEDADVIALYLTDLHLDEHNVGQGRTIVQTI